MIDALIDVNIYHDSPFSFFRIYTAVLNSLLQIPISQEFQGWGGWVCAETLSSSRTPQVHWHMLARKPIQENNLVLY